MSVRMVETSVEGIVAALRMADDLTAKAVGMIAALAPTGRIEAETGLPAEVALRLEARRTRWDARELAASADALAQMPRTRAALSEGLLSWSQVRAIVRASREVRSEDRARVDGLVGDRAPALQDSEPERIVDLVDDEVARLRSDLLTHREEHAIETAFLMLSPRLTGGGTVYGEADTESFAVIAEALDAAADRPVADQGSDGEPTLRARQRMEALVRICDGSLGGERAGTRPRPRFLATLDLAGMTEAGFEDAARVLWRLAGRPGRLSPLGTEVAACDAEWVPIIFDGARPVWVGDPTKDVPDKIRAAIVARDGGCRFPGCSAPAAWSQIHHIAGRSPGARCEACDLVLLCLRCHRRVHRDRWRIEMEPDGTFRFERRGRRYTSPPRTGPPRRE